MPKPLPTRRLVPRQRVAVGYVRVSSERQVENGVSIDAQKARIRAWCDSNGYELARMHVDAGLSGARADNRPALQRALADACKKRAALVVYSLSRLARSTRDAIDAAERLDRGNADLVSLTEEINTTSATGRMIFRLLAVLSEFERDLVAERTRTALAHKAANGERISRHAPFGFRFNTGGNVIRDPKEYPVVETIRVLHAEGRGYGQIARELERRGIVGRSGTPLSRKTVRAILRRCVPGAA